MNRSFDLRCEMAPVDPRQIELIETGRRAGAATNSAGSGGSVIGLVRDIDDLDAVMSEYERLGAHVLALG